MVNLYENEKKVIFKLNNDVEFFDSEFKNIKKYYPMENPVEFIIS
ncbi:hypothetical protein [Methanobrevibacter sp.]|nr:hypothetical protein [Methanobrevibacter sp.]MDO5859535.1 hypothetical protein [Methanobrevibacter sp.]